jgi:hypothetical protein
MTRRPTGGSVALRRFWFEFDRTASQRAFMTPWCGVTAFDLDDAQSLIETRVFPEGLPKVLRVVEDVDVSTLDADHVLLNMAPPNWRGIWYPLGYQDSIERRIVPRRQ